MTARILFAFFAWLSFPSISFAAKPHAVVIAGTHHYSPNITMPLFAAELERLGFETTVINPDWNPEKDKRGLPGLEALEKADVAIFFVRFLKLNDAQLAPINKYLESGKPLVALRTSTHAFNYPEKHPQHALNIDFGKRAFGTPYLIHLQGKTKIELSEKAAKHEIFTGITSKTWNSPGTLYLTKFQPNVTPLLSGTGSPNKPGIRKNAFGSHDLKKVMTDTVAWTWENEWGGRVFGTSLGHVGDFAVPESMRMMVNGVFWAAGQAVPSADTKIKPLAPKTKKKKSKRTAAPEKPKPSKTALPDISPVSEKLTLFYGNSFVERLQEDGTFEALSQVATKGENRQFRSFAYTGDEVGFRIRPEKFGDHLGYLERQLSADQVVMCFGANESFAGLAGLPTFRKNLNIYLQLIKERHPQAKLFLVSPTAIEHLEGGHFPDAKKRNKDVTAYRDAMKTAAAKYDLSFIDLFEASNALYQNSDTPLTQNGFHLNQTGNRAIAKVLAGQLTDTAKVDAIDTQSAGFTSLRKLVTRKAYEVSMAYHPANGIHYYGTRSRPFEYASEIPHHLKLANLIDKSIWKQAANLSQETTLPKLPITQAEPPKKNPKRGLGVIKTAQEDLKDFTIADGFELNLFASSQDFPELINPLQISFDDRGRLWVACNPSYPVPRPGELSNDTILILEDSNNDGKADKKTIFADGLKLPDGFVFHKDGIVVSVARQLLWLRDTDGDDIADRTEELLRGADDTDTHHGGYLTTTPQGHIIYCEGLFHRGQFETPQGPVRTKDATALLLDPHTQELTIERQTTHPNPWKISYNQWGESIQMFGGGQIIDCDFYNISTPVGTSSSSSMGMPFRDDKGCSLELVASSHFPKEWQGGLLTAHLLGSNAVLYTPIGLKEGTYLKTAKSKSLLSSTNKSFRPVDLKFGLDGALYISDFYYPIIGHAQHSIRDTNRDYTNGRIWRVTKKGSDLSTPPKIKGASIDELFTIITHPQTRIRELAREALLNHPSEKVLEKAKALAASSNTSEHLALELLWLFERARDYSQTELFRRLTQSNDINIQRAAARSLRWWAPTLGAEAKVIAQTFSQSKDDRLRIAVVSVASYLLKTDPTWKQFIDTVEAPSGSPLDRVAKLASLYDTPALNPEFPLLKVAEDSKITSWLMHENGTSGSLIVKCSTPLDLVLGYRANPYINLDLNNIPLRRATGSQHTKNGQINITLKAGENKIEFFSALNNSPKKGKYDLYLANLIGSKPEGLTFPADESEHEAWTKAYNDKYATVTDDRIYIKTVPSQMAFNVTKFTVKAGQEYNFIFENLDHMLHNIVITKPNQGTAVGELANAMAAKPDAIAKHYIPESDLVLFSTPQIPYGEKVTSKFTTPKKPGRYPFICTFPGHWGVMKGIMIVK